MGGKQEREMTSQAQINGKLETVQKEQETSRCFNCLTRRDTYIVFRAEKYFS